MVNAETMAKLRPSSNTREIDRNYPQGNRPVQPIVARSLHRARPTEDPQGEPSDRKLTEALYKPRISHSLQFCSPRSEKPDKKSWKKKKEQYCQKQRQSQNSRTRSQEATQLPIAEAAKTWVTSSVLTVIRRVTMQINVLNPSKTMPTRKISSYFAYAEPK